MKRATYILTAIFLIVNINLFAGNEKTLENKSAVSINNKNNINKTLIVVKNMLGEVLYTKVEVEEIGNILVVDKKIQKLPKGIYVIIATSNNQIFKKKIMIK